MKQLNLDNPEEEYLLGKLQHLLVADCPDCGRVVIHKNKCGKCNGDSWLPAGYVNRQWVKKVYNDNKEESTLVEGLSS